MRKERDKLKGKSVLSLRGKGPEKKKGVGAVNGLR